MDPQKRFLKCTSLASSQCEMEEEIFWILQTSHLISILSGNKIMYLFHLHIHLSTQVGFYYDQQHELGKCRKTVRSINTT